MIDKILVAVAGRGLCEEMLNMLLEIPAIQRAAITVLHVVTPQIIADAMSAKLEEGGKILAQAVKSIKADPNQITPILKTGDPKDIVCQIAEEEKVDLIIMGSRALGRIEAILENSVSQYVFQLTSRPMLLVKDDVFIKRIKRIMIAMDGSPDAEQSFKLAQFLAKDISGAELLLTHINPDKNIASPDQDPVFASGIKFAKQLGIAYRCINSVGNSGEQLCKLADELNADLLIMGSPDRRPSIARALVDLDRLLGSSQSDYVRVKANCPVLLSRRVVG